MLDHGTIPSKDLVARIRSDLNSGSRKSGSGELKGEGEYSGGELDLVQTESSEGRQLQRAETEEVTSLGEEDLMVLFLTLCLEDFLGGSGKWLSETSGFMAELLMV